MSVNTLRNMHDLLFYIIIHYLQVTNLLQLKNITKLQLLKHLTIQCPTFTLGISDNYEMQHFRDGHLFHSFSFQKCLVLYILGRVYKKKKKQLFTFMKLSSSDLNLPRFSAFLTLLSNLFYSLIQYGKD